MLDSGAKGSPKHFATKCGLALTAVVLALLVRWLLDPLLNESFPLITMFGAVAAAVWFGGYRLALLTATLGYLGCAYLFFEHRGTFGLSGYRNLVSGWLSITWLVMVFTISSQDSAESL
jgi:K+-sensing histidine kinase KdpD